MVRMNFHPVNVVNNMDQVGFILALNLIIRIVILENIPINLH